MDFDRVLELSKKRLSEDQRKVVFSNRATIVSAGAGSGKTTVLSLRFLRLINDGVDADRILTITFTKKAAAEMYERIHALLRAMAKEDSCFAYQLKEKFPSASISTMDSFWTDIARSGSLKYGISRDFTLEDDDTRIRLVRKVYTMLSTAGNTDTPVCDIVSNEDILRGFSFFSSINDPNSLEKKFNEIARNTDILTALPDDTDALFYRPLIVGYYRKFNPLRKIMQILLTMEILAANVSSKCSKSIFRTGVFDTLKEKVESYCKLIPDNEDEQDEWIFNFIENIDLSQMPELKVGNAKQADDKEVDRVIKKELLEKYRECLSHIRRLKQMIYNRSYQSDIDKVFRAFVYLYNKEKRARAILSFADVQAIAKEVLINDHSIRDYYKSRFDYIMVDEFQDNNLEQRNLLYLLSERLDIHSEGIPDASDLDKKKLFLVGDDKQSIYRFRGADVSVFNDLKREIVEKMDGLSLSLGANYRSEPMLVEHFNDIFSEVFKQQEEDIDPIEELVSQFRGIEEGDYHAEAKGIEAGRSKSTVSPVIELATIACEKMSEEEKANYLSPSESEAIYIADKILEIVNGEEYMIPDSSGMLKKPSFDDIGILYRKSSIQMNLEKELRHREIPYTVIESTSSTLEGIAYDIFNFLQLVVYPSDKLAFMALLNSPFARISQKGQSFLQGSQEDFEAFKDEISFDLDSDRIAYDNLKTLYLRVKDMSGHYTLAEILDEIYFTSGYHTYIQSSGNLSVYSEHYDYLWELAGKLDADGIGIVGALDFLRPIIGKSEKLDGISIGRIESKGVKLMTIHKSKGLEFPIVFLADAGAIFKAFPSSFVNVDTDSGIFMTQDISAAEVDYTTNPYAGIFNHWEGNRLAAERRRLLYVALTRAINHFIMVADEPSEGAKSESLYTIYMKAFLEAIERSDTKNWNYKISSVPLIAKNDGIKSIAPLRRDLSWLDDAGVYSPPIWNTKKVAAKDASHAEFESTGKGERLPVLSIDSITAKHPSFKTGFGSWVHQALEEKLTGNDAITDFESDIPLNKADEEILLCEAKRIADDFAKSEFFETYVAGKDLVAELAFYYPDGERVLQGSADLVVFADEYNLVIDYKTDKYRTPEEHKGQIVTYVKAMEDLYGKKCYGILCYVRDFSKGPVWDRDGNEVEL